MNEGVRSALIELARKNRTINYQDLCDQCKLGLNMRASEFDRAEIGRILGEVSAYEHNYERPLISSLVITKGQNEQGDGFYKLCESLGFGSWKKLKSDMTFEIGQMNASFDYWKDDNNYTKYK